MSVAEISPVVLDALRQSSAATVATVLRKHGLRSVCMHGPRPLRPGQARLVGIAATLRFVPAREDISTSESATGPTSARAVVQHFPKGSVVVAAMQGIANAGLFGDIVAAHMQNIGLTGLIADGPMRDLAGHIASGWPIWAIGTVPPPSPEGLFLADQQVPVGCGGVTVFPGDVIVADDDGVVVIPQAMVETVAEQAVEMERFESWVHAQVKAGAPLTGLYPPGEETLERYRREVAGQ